MATRLQLRRDTSANWTSANPTLGQGELGIETDTKKAKVGDGSTAWNTLAYWPSNMVSPTISGGTFSDVAENYAVHKSPKEVITVSATAATGTIQFDALTQAVLWYTTNASANFTLNFRGSATVALNTALATGNILGLVFMNTNGATPYYPTAFTIDGVSVTPKWAGGVAPAAGNASAIDAYSFTIIKTGSAAYTVLAGAVKFA